LIIITIIIDSHALARFGKMRNSTGIMVKLNIFKIQFFYNLESSLKYNQ
jgi:hypothetical protein